MRTILLAAAAAALLLPSTASAAGFEPISTSGLGLTKTGLTDADYARVAKLEQKYPRSSVGAVIASANREVQPLGNAPELKGVKDVSGGFRWNPGDNAVDYWWPQGITGSADATPGGVVDGHRELLVSWYSKNGKGTRVSFVNADSLSNTKYRHVLLVEPNDSGGFGLVQSHAGGIAWVGDYLYVAETDGGLRVFDMRHLLKVPNPDDALGYAFILPQVGLYKTEPGLRFSFVALDRTNGPALVTGEYKKGAAGGRIVRWPLGADNLPTRQGRGGLHVARGQHAGRADAQRQGRLVLERRRGQPRRVHDRRARRGDHAAHVGRGRGGREPTPPPAGASTRSPSTRARASCSAFPLPRSVSERTATIASVTALAIVLGLAIGLIVGAVGGGGAILALPVLIYVLGEPVGPAATASLVVVSVAAAIGAGSLARHGRVCWRLAFTFAAPAAAGSLLGTFAQPQRRRGRAGARVRAR